MEGREGKEGKEHEKAEKRKQEGIEDLMYGKEVPDIKSDVKTEEPPKKGKKNKKRAPKG
ncbi:uncharacterized protein DS421_19g655570 [Arachis hypogaea]|uniref:Uncharacterized protein n=1 Tax=Arachis hypogaea TaxID=3818 RepID=A0A6B9VBW8_ARAHY|nr:uncharacterized protein DS421_19g655570 [Arachis hypogaea]